MRLPIDASRSTFISGSDPGRQHAMAVDARRTEQRSRSGRAYRAGRLICAFVDVTIGLDGRLGLTRDERRLVRVRFHEPLDDDLRAELAHLVRRRGAAACRVADSLKEIAIVLDEPDGDRVRIIGRLQPPQVRHARLRDVEFGLAELTETR